MKVPDPPDRLFAELFEAVQRAQLLGDSKTFVDAVANTVPADIVAAFRAQRDKPGFDLGKFVAANFELPATNAGAVSDAAGMSAEDRIEQLWHLLTRGPDAPVSHSSLIPLPNRYVVPGGRFREVYYWDSYFTMLGLADSGHVDLVREMVENFAWLIDEIGFVPNGNRSYYCTRSQPPFFALMVDLLAEATMGDAVHARFLPQLEREYAFWMDGAENLDDANRAHRRVVVGPGGYLNRYWDDSHTPRQESFAEDTALAAGSIRLADELYRDIRAGAESGWDFSSRWFEDGQSLTSIRTTQIVPVDLNALLCHLETTLARVFRQQGDDAKAELFDARAACRAEQLRTLFFDAASGTFMDLSLPDFAVTGTRSLATTFPLFFGIATPAQARRVARCLRTDLLKAGGWVTSARVTGQQWDSPNGWAPLQWMTFCGLDRYGFHDEARTGARRWIDNVVAIYRAHGRLLEKYDVVSCGHAGTGGEYEVQDGFGWTNGVLLRLMREAA